jgi:hypothetical protein
MPADRKLAIYKEDTTGATFLFGQDRKLTVMATTLGSCCQSRCSTKEKQSFLPSTEVLFLRLY